MSKGKEKEFQDFDDFYKRSKTRESLFNWYPFKEGASLLEVRGGSSSLIGLFCSKVKSVTSLVKNKVEKEHIEETCQDYGNLEVLIVEDERGLKFSRKFDYIIILDALEYSSKGYKGIGPYIDYVRFFLDLLNSKGTLLLATDNRYGLKYFCGEPDPISKTPFMGLNRYPKGSTGYLLSRQELVNIMEALEANYKFYYPLPDHRFPQLIYTDKFLPEKNLRERLLTYTRDQSSLLISELRLYDDLIDNKVFPFFANSFLLEIKMEGCLTDINHIVLSTDRGDHGFATLIKDRGIVEKWALTKKGGEYLQDILNNGMELDKRGIKTVEQKLKKMHLQMPQYKSNSLSMYLKNIIREDVVEFIKVFDLLYEEILKSSDQVDLEKSQFYKINPNKNYWGPILEKAYLDMIPINCFWESNQMIFFDQEFMRENYPAKYVLYRAIKYTYLFIPYANSIYPQENLKERYNLVDVWDFYEKLEKDFVYDNREIDKYSLFWEWSKIDQKKILENIDKIIK